MELTEMAEALLRAEKTRILKDSITECNKLLFKIQGNSIARIELHDIVLELPKSIFWGGENPSNEVNTLNLSNALINLLTETIANEKQRYEKELTKLELANLYEQEKASPTAQRPYSDADYADAKRQGLDLDDWSDYARYYGLGEEELY